MKFQRNLILDSIFIWGMILPISCNSNKQTSEEKIEAEYNNVTGLVPDCADPYVLQYDGMYYLYGTGGKKDINGPGHHSFATSPLGQLYMIYHTHFDMTKMGPRKVGIDMCEFVKTETGKPDVLKVYGPTSTPQVVK